VTTIQKIEQPRNRKEVQSFLGKVNFLQRFIPDFVEILKLMSDMLKKGNEIKWTEQAKESFSDIKKALGQAPLLTSPDFSKKFVIFSFAS